MRGARFLCPQGEAQKAMTVADHNSARWLRIEYRGKRGGKIGWRFEPGWFVVRTCPCHPNKPVTLALPDEAAARRAVALLALHQQVQVAPHTDGQAEKSLESGRPNPAKAGAIRASADFG
jgi:hypothetical protein